MWLIRERKNEECDAQKDACGVAGSLVGDSMNECADFFPKSSHPQSESTPNAARTGGDGR
jgi:hypothetical protein